jgi:4a-hydroxytetrahydrobiopterin dehydratase
MLISKFQKSGSVDVHWTTHHPRESISQKDIFMAEYCDEQAKIIGTVERRNANRCGPSLPSPTGKAERP